VRLNRIYTKAGDGGETRLVGGQKVAKDSLRIDAYGTVDELSACLGIARTELAAAPAPAGAPELAALVPPLQNEPSHLGSHPATLPEDPHPQQPLIEARHVAALEREIDGWNAALPELRSFVLPGGGRVAAALHLARTVCRRAERDVLRLMAVEGGGEGALAYPNRPSHLLFLLSRLIRPHLGGKEILLERPLQRGAAERR